MLPALGLLVRNRTCLDFPTDQKIRLHREGDNPGANYFGLFMIFIVDDLPLILLLSISTGLVQIPYVCPSEYALLWPFTGLCALNMVLHKSYQNVDEDLYAIEIGEVDTHTPVPAAIHAADAIASDDHCT